MSDKQKLQVKKVELHDEGIIALLQSENIMNCLLSNASKVGSVEDTFVGFDRCHVVVKED